MARYENEISNLRRLTLSYDRTDRSWALTEDGSWRELARFDRKGDALAGRLADFAGAQGASVKIQNPDGSCEEERTYPRSGDPRRSEG